MKLGFKKEKEYQIFLGKYFQSLGYDVYTDKKICELPTFHGNANKPDLLIFYKKNNRSHSLINISNPFAIEIKKSDKLNSLTKAILQIKKYNGLQYHTKNWNGILDTVLLSTDLCFLNGHCYDWIKNKDFNDGLNWCLNHVLFTVSNSSGIVIMKNEELLVEFHNCTFKFDKGGIITYSHKYNGYGNDGISENRISIDKEDDTKTTTTP